MSTAFDCESVYPTFLNRPPSEQERAGNLQRFARTDPLQVVHELLASAEFTRRRLDHVIDVHLHLIHAVRVQLVSTLLPSAARIMDLGGANAPLHQMGYPHPFEEIILVDLPPEDRCEMYRGLQVQKEKVGDGVVSVLYTDMADLSAIPTSSIDLVWMGQAIEHITEEHSWRLYREVRRVLKPDGHFCLDTPNGLLTRIHTGGPMIHPEHKIEYEPDHLRANLENAGFPIQRQLGLCEMIETARTGQFHYSDFLIGGAINTNVRGSYLQYYQCGVTKDPPVGGLLHLSAGETAGSLGKPRFLNKLGRRLRTLSGRSVN